MKERYEYDPSAVDISSNDGTLDNWKPRVRKKTIVKSEWRQMQNAGNHNQQPGIDEIKKINGYLKRKYPDFEIMDAFGISAETLVAIKRDCYCPVDGISLDNLSKIYKEFTRLENRLAKLTDAIKFIADNAFNDSYGAKRETLRQLIKVRKKEPEYEDDEPDDII